MTKKCVTIKFYWTQQGLHHQGYSRSFFDALSPPIRRRPRPKHAPILAFWGETECMIVSPAQVQFTLCFLLNDSAIFATDYAHNWDAYIK
jgi:hypothetical protein